MNQKTIKIAYLASGLIGRKASGTAQTARKIIEYIILNTNQKFEVTLLLKSENEKAAILEDPMLSNCNLVVLPQVKGRILRSSRQYYKYCKLSKKLTYDIMYFSVPRVYPFYWHFPAKYFVCTFHAAGDITVPTNNFVFSKFLYNLIMKLQWKHLDFIFADSDFAITEIHENYKIPLSRITKVYLGADNLWLKSSEKPLDFNLEQKTLLIVGRWQKYKNIHSIIEAIKQSDVPEVKNCNVIVLGKKVKSEMELFIRSIENFPTERLQIIDYLSDSEMKFLFSSVNVVIHPSINEGFGIPAFEAFGEGAVLVVHNGTPAASYLKLFDSVLVEDLTNIRAVETVIVRALNLPRRDVTERRDYLIRMEMTWDYVGRNYVKYLRSLNFDN